MSGKILILGCSSREGRALLKSFSDDNQFTVSAVTTNKEKFDKMSKKYSKVNFSLDSLEEEESIKKVVEGIEYVIVNLSEMNKKLKTSKRIKYPLFIKFENYYYKNFYTHTQKKIK